MVAFGKIFFLEPFFLSDQGTKKNLHFLLVYYADLRAEIINCLLIANA